MQGPEFHRAGLELRGGLDVVALELGFVAPRTEIKVGRQHGWAVQSSVEPPRQFAQGLPPAWLGLRVQLVPVVLAVPALLPEPAAPRAVEAEQSHQCVELSRYRHYFHKILKVLARRRLTRESVMTSSSYLPEQEVS